MLVSFSMRFLTNANMSFQNHADIIGTISNGKGDWAAFRVFHHFNNLRMEQYRGSNNLKNLKPSVHCENHYFNSLMNKYFTHFNRLFRPVPFVEEPCGSRAQTCSFDKSAETDSCSDLSWIQRRS